MLYNIVLVSAVHWSELATCIHTSPPSWTSSHPFPCPTEHRAERYRHFSKEDTQGAKRCVKRSWTSLIMRETRIKTTMSYHHAPVRTAVAKKSTSNKCWLECGEKRSLLYCSLLVGVWIDTFTMEKSTEGP